MSEIQIKFNRQGASEDFRINIDHKDFFGPIPSEVKINNLTNIKEFNLPFNDMIIEYYDGALTDQITKAHNNISYIPSGIINNHKTIALYHYTSKENFSNIISSKELWASKIGSMNDYSEIEYTRDSFLTQISNILRERKNENSRDIISRVRAIFDDKICKNIYSISFSKRANLLSQWNRYGGESGVSLGFNLLLLKEACIRDKNKNLILIEYDSKIQASILKKIAIKFLANYKHSFTDNEFSEYFLNNFKKDLDKLVCSFKQGGFREEEEVRLIIEVEEKDNNLLKSNIGKEYYRFNYNKVFRESQKLDFDFEYIFSAPNENSQKRLKEIWKVLSESKMKFLSIIASEIPYKWH